MKSLKNFITESQVNNTVKELFDDIDQKLAHQEWDEVAPIIEEIFKNKWGKTIKLDDKFRDTIRRGEQLLLGYNIKTKAWVIVYYNARYNAVYGCSYSDNKAREIGRGPTYWGDIEHFYKDEKLKFRYADFNSDECRSVIGGINNADYNYDD